MRCTRGSMYDVLDRYYQAARRYQADVIVRITADCPVIDPDVIDETVGALFGMQDQEIGDRETVPGNILPHNSQFLTPVYDFTANRLPPPWKRTYPIGLDTRGVHLRRRWKAPGRRPSSPTSASTSCPSSTSSRSVFASGW